MPTDVYLLPCSFLFTLGMLSMAWPEVLREFAWLHHRRRTVRVVACMGVVTGALCWAARDYCSVPDVAASFSLVLIAIGFLLTLAPYVGLWGLRILILARKRQIRLLGVTIVLFSWILTTAASPKPPSQLPIEILAAALSFSVAL